MSKNSLYLLSILILTLIVTSCSHTPQSTQIAESVPTSQVSTLTQAKLDEDSFWQGNSSTTWNRLQHISLRKLETTKPMSDPTRAAWIKLAIISKRYTHDSNQLVQQLMTWRNENVNHPGNTLFQANGTISSITNSPHPKHIALLLPLQGQMGSSGQAVRNGFLSAYYESLKKTHVQETISFYDTSNHPNIAELYLQAVGNGADIIVGPLMREDVQALVNSGSINVPTLALNYTEGSLPMNLYEFGLSPVDEALQVADKAFASGRSRAIVIFPQTAWGQRVSKNLMERWQTLGGKISDTFYFTNSTDFNRSIANLLRVNPKEDRKKMEEENNKIVLEQQRRHDFDVIFLLAYPQAARAIVPLLKYYYAENIPIYSTSMVYGGSPNPQKDTDLNGVIFADVPWLIKGSHNTSRLYAVGRDAFVISSELPRLMNLPNFPLYGATGALTLNASHQIYRRLPWTQIHNGHP